jgi:glutamine amidotransferase
MKIVIVDYGMGNIKSIKSTLEYIGVTDIEISDKAELLHPT